MAKGTKKFSKQSIDVRVTALPSGEEAVTYNLEQSVASLLTSIASGMGSFYLGNGLFGKDANTFIAKAKTNKKSLLGKSDSIFALLEEIKSQMFSESQKSEIIYHLNKQTQILSNGLICSDSTPFLVFINKQLSDLVQALSQTKENIVVSNDNDELLKNINLIISNQIEKPFDDINSKLSAIIDSYIQTIQNYDADNKEKLKLLEETKETETKVLLESNIDSTINEFIKFINENTDKLISNTNKLVLNIDENIQKFFDALKPIKELKIEETLGSLSMNISHLFDTINNLSEIQKNDIINNLNKQSQILKSGIFIDESKPFLSLINQQLSKLAQLLSQPKENIVVSNDNDELLKDINLAISNQIEKPFDDINSKLSEIIDSYIQTIQNYDADNREKLKLLGETKEAKIKILLEGIESSTIQDLVNFTNQNTDNLVSNIDNINKFFESLKSIQDLKINETLSSINGIIPLLTVINQMIDKSKDLPNINQEIIEKIFGKDNGALNILIKALNSLSEYKIEKEEKIKTSLEGVNSSLKVISELLVGSVQELQKMNKMAYTIFNISPEFIYEQISKVFGVSKAKSSAVNKIDSKLGNIIKCINSLEDINENKVKSVGKSILGISEIFGMAFLMYSVAFPLAYAYKKVFNKADFSLIFNDLKTIFKDINSFNQIDNGKTEQIVNDLKNIRKTINNIFLLALESKLINMAITDKDGAYPYIIRISDLITSVRDIFNDINNDTKIIDITNKTSIIDVNIKSLYKTLLHIQILGALGVASKFNIFRSLSSIEYLFDNDPKNKKYKFFGEEVPGHNLSTLFNVINKSKVKVDITPILNNVKAVETIITTINKLKLNRNIQKKLEEIINLFNNDTTSKKFGIGKETTNRKLTSSLEDLFKAINLLTTNINNNNFKKVETGIKHVFGIISLLNEIGKQKNIKKVQKNIDLYFEALEEFYKKVDEKFDRIIQTSENVDKLKSANKKIHDGLDDCTETAVKTSKDTKEVNQGLMTLQGLTEFMISAAVVMSIGALFMMLGGGKFVKAALEFGITLMTFEMLVITPILMFRGIQKNAEQSLNGLSSFVITCTIMMSVGALFIQLGGGKFVKNALTFGIILGIFEMLVVAPFLAFYKHQTNVMKGLSEFSTFLITTTIIMSIGALFMNFGGGKFAKNALTFGIILGIFEALVIAPFILFGAIKGEVFDNAKDFISIVITCTTILLIGALFMSIKNGALARNGLKFAATLMLFEAMVIAPFLLMNALKSQVFNGMKLFSTIIISSTIILMVGALFMGAKGGQLWKQSLKFTALLFAFEVGVIIPFLLFRKMEDQAIKGLIGFGAIVIASATILMVGSLFMSMNNGLNGLYALEFTGVLSIFVLSLGGVAKTLNKWLDNKEIVKMEEFGTFVLLSTAALITGALFIEKYGPLSIIGYGIILSLFVGIMGGIAVGISKWLKKKTIIQMEAFGTFVMLSSLALISGALFVKMYGVGSVIEYAICLLGFVTITTLVASWIAKSITPKALVDISLFNTFLLTATGSMILGAWFIEKYSASSIGLFMVCLLGFVTEAALIMFALEVLSPFIGLGIIVGAALGIALFTLTTSIMLVNALFLLDPGGKKTQENLKILNDEVLNKGIMDTFVNLGLLSPLIALGSIAAIAIGVSMLLLGGSLALINLIIGNNGKEIKDNIDKLKNILYGLSDVYSLLGALSWLIIPGSIAAVAIGTSMILLGGSLALIHKVTNKELLSDIGYLMLVVGELSIFSLELIAASIPMALAIPATGIMTGLSLGILTSTMAIYKAVNKMSELGDLTEPIKLIISNLNKFIEIPDKIFDGNWLKNLSRINDLYILKEFTKPMSEIMLETAKAIQSMAELKVPNNWDKDGNVISYRQLKDHDFELATKNTGTLLKTMAFAFYDTWEGEGDHQGKGLRALYTKNYRAIDNIVNFGIQSGEVIKGISEGIANMAKLQIPIAWDENGHPIGYRQLSTQDFSDAAAGTRIILMSMADAIIATYDKGADKVYSVFTNGKNIFDFDELDGSPLGNTLEASFKMAELIGKVGTVVGNIAKMQIPEDWDSKGNVTEYRKLNSNDFKQMGENVKTILGAISQCIGDLYYEGRPEGELNKNFYSGNIFDAISSGSWFKDDQPSHFEQVLSASFKMSELISNIGQGIKDIAIMQIADDWDEKGHAIHYKHLTSTDFKDAGTSVAKIVTGIVNGLKGVKLDTVKTAAEIINAMMPINELISGMADGIIKIAAGQIPVYEADGKTIKEYKHLEPTDYEKAGQSIGLVVNAIATKIQTIAKDDKQQINKIFTDGTFENISKSLGSMTGLVSGIVDSVIKIGTCQIPDAWDKDGNPTHYKPVDLSQAQVDLTSTVSNIISAMSTAVITAYNNNKEMFAENPSGNTPFAIAVKGITGVTKIISGITDSVVKISQAQIPTKWNDQGSPIWYEKVNINTAIANMKRIFNDPDNGLLNILCNVINKTYDKWFSGTNNITKKVGPIATNIGKITKLISSSSDIIVKLSSLSIPESFDKDGNGKNYHKLNENDIDAAKQNAINIITALFDIPKSINPKLVLDNNLTIEEWTSTTISNISKIGGVISAATGVAEKFAKYQEIANKLFGNKTKVEKFDASFTKDLTTNIELIKGIYAINLQQNIESKSSIERIASDLNNFVTYGINSFDKTSLERFNMLNKSMNTIYETFKKQKDVSANIKNNTNQLSNYIKAINTIKVSKVDSLTNLVRELNIFSDKMGNLDKLTEAIAEKLSVVLANLVEKLEESKKTIETAETIQTKRHILIDKAIKDVKEIMENPISVRVSSDTTESEDDGRGKGQTNESEDRKQGGAYAKLDARQKENKEQTSKTDGGQTNVRTPKDPEAHQ